MDNDRDNEPDRQLDGEAPSPGVAEATAERRQHRRHEVSVPVTVDVEQDRYECRISNVGSGGAFLTPRLDLPVGQRLKLQAQHARVCATAGVRRVDSSGIGVAFDDETLGAIVAGWSRRIVT